MTSLTENIVNRVDKLPKPGNYAQALQPVFEAISNSRYAIFDRFEDEAVTKGQISVLVSKLASPADVEIIVQDNGVGLDETRFKAFCVVDTDYKKSKGGKGVGRLFWLDAFKIIDVSSKFGDADGDRRSFKFILRDANQIENNPTDMKRDTVGTSVIFSGLRDNEYIRNFPKREDVFLRYFSSHFISDFLMGVSPTINVVIDGKSTKFPAAVRDLVAQDFESISWESERYGVISATGFLCDVTASAGLDGRHQVHLLADHRTVESRKVDGLIGLGPISTEASDDLCLHVCVDSPYLDARVNEGRTAFNIPESELKKITREIVDKVKSEFIKEQIAKYKIVRAENYREFIQSYPIYDYDDPETQLEKVSFGANSPEEFAAGLVKDQIRQEEERKKNLQSIICEISEGELDSADFSKTIIKVADELQKSEKLSLAQHVVRRKMIIDLMEVLLKRYRKVGDREDHYLEKTVHSVLCPTGVNSKDSSKLVARSHDLWVVDERLAFSRAFASDKRIDGILSDNDSQLRPDIIVWDIAYGLAYYDDEEGEVDVSKPVNEMMIIELKKPMRSNYKKYEDNIEQQIIKYINELKGGAIEGFARDRVRIKEDCIFHCFVVADLVGDLKVQLGGWAKTPDGEGRYRPLQGDHRGSITVIQWKDLINDAWMRNQSTLNAAGLRRTSRLISEMQDRLAAE
ncbi:hypothetical protein [Novosphingobium sp. TH158]|uniref:hypothetical protein n=1 Tax=Novosphingobium sp. TH158 TaxID=2067455 RepID=UPI00118191FE|nr:hypothetical protein [Novosphingobium sp. TH158]